MDSTRRAKTFPPYDSSQIKCPSRGIHKPSKHSIASSLSHLTSAQLDDLVEEASGQTSTKYTPRSQEWCSEDLMRDRIKAYLGTNIISRSSRPSSDVVHQFVLTPTSHQSIRVSESSRPCMTITQIPHSEVPRSCKNILDIFERIQALDTPHSNCSEKGCTTLESGDDGWKISWNCEKDCNEPEHAQRQFRTTASIPPEMWSAIDLTRTRNASAIAKQLIEALRHEGASPASLALFGRVFGLSGNAQSRVLEEGESESCIQELDEERDEMDIEMARSQDGMSPTAETPSQVDMSEGNLLAGLLSKLSVDQPFGRPDTEASVFPIAE